MSARDDDGLLNFLREALALDEQPASYGVSSHENISQRQGAGTVSTRAMLIA
jgi:hypothetical protein